MSLLAAALVACAAAVPAKAQVRVQSDVMVPASLGKKAACYVNRGKVHLNTEGELRSGKVAVSVILSHHQLPEKFYFDAGEIAWGEWILDDFDTTGILTSLVTGNPDVLISDTDVCNDHETCEAWENLGACKQGFSWGKKKDVGLDGAFSFDVEWVDGINGRGNTVNISNAALLVAGTDVLVALRHRSPKKNEPVGAGDAFLTLVLGFDEEVSVLKAPGLAMKLNEGTGVTGNPNIGFYWQGNLIAQFRLSELRKIGN